MCPPTHPISHLLEGLCPSNSPLVTGLGKTKDVWGAIAGGVLALARHSHRARFSSFSAKDIGKKAPPGRAGCPPALSEIGGSAPYDPVELTTDGKRISRYCLCRFVRVESDVGYGAMEPWIP